MPLANTTQRWGSVARFLHWSVVLLLIAQFILASIAEDLPLGLEKLATLARHKSVGITILALAALRLLWRAFSAPAPPLPETMRPWERGLARGSHAALYALLFAMPLSGWAMSSAKNYPVSWFGVFQLPDFVAPSERLYEALHETHETLAGLLIAVTVLHVLGALKHHFIDRDAVLRRMLPFARTVLLPFVLAATALAGMTFAPQPAFAAAATAPAKPAAAAATSPAAASLRRYVLDPAASKLEFLFQQAGAEVTGRFKRFEVTLDWPAANAPRGARLAVDIDVGSVDTRDAERDALLRGESLFDVQRTPRASFVSTEFTPLEAGRWRARGTLTLRGTSRPVALELRELRFQPPAGAAHALLAGETKISRLEFGVGRGEWSSTEWVGDEVTVRFTTQLRANAAAPVR